MIHENELLDAIAECHGERNPNANTCRNLAAYYTILDHVQERPMNGYSNSAGMSHDQSYSSDTEFGRVIRGRELSSIMPLIDELMTTIEIIQPRLYNAVMMKLKEG